MEWLTTPKADRQPPFKQGLADELGVSPRVLSDWQQRPDFRDAWDREAKAVVGTPERAQAVLDELYKAATDPTNRAQVQAAKLYLEATNSIRPPSIEVTVKKTTELTDDELDALLTQGATALREERNAGLGIVDD
jgi:hypothetical protein